VGAYPEHYLTTDKKGFCDPDNIAAVDVDGVRAMELRVVSGKNNGTGERSGATPEARPLGPKKDGFTTGRADRDARKLDKTGPGGHFVPLGWPRRNEDWPKNGEPDYVEIGTDGSPTVGGWFHVQNGGSSGQGQSKLVSDVSMLDWFTVTAERIPGKSYRWYVNGKLYRQLLAPGGVPKEEERAVTTVLNSPYNLPLYELRWPIQFESKGTSQTNDVIVSLITGHCGSGFNRLTAPACGARLAVWLNFQHGSPGTCGETAGSPDNRFSDGRRLDRRPVVDWRSRYWREMGCGNHPGDTGTPGCSRPNGADS
jgi:hypothetical protein